MAEVIGLIASIIEVAAFGLKLSRTLHDYGTSVVGAEKRLKGLDKEIEFTSRVLSQLGNVLKDSVSQALATEESINLARDAVAECDAVFQAMEEIIANIRKNGLGKWKMYFRESKIDFLRSNLDRMKGNLQLLMGVIVHATQIATEFPDKPTLDAHRMKIRELMLEKEMYTQRYLHEKEKYDALLAKVNSTSTLGSTLTIQSVTLEPGASGTSGTQPSFRLQAIDPGRDPSENTGMAVVGGQLGGPFQDGAATNATTFTFTVVPYAFTNSGESKFAIQEEHPEATTSSLHVSNGASPSSSSPEQDLSVEQPPTSPITATDHLRFDSPPPIATYPSKQQSTERPTKSNKRGTPSLALLVIVGAVFFPISIPLYLVFRGRRRAKKGPHPEADAPTTVTGYMPAPQFWSPEGAIGRSTNAMSYQGEAWERYSSSAIPAELMGIHELDSTAPELDLTSRLTRVRLGSERTESV